MNSPLEVWILCTFKLGFCFDLRNLKHELSILKFWFELLKLEIKGVDFGCDDVLILILVSIGC